MSEDSYRRWAAERLVADPDAEVHGEALRRDYVAWCSDRLDQRRLPIGKQRAAVLGVGPEVTRKGRSAAETRYLGVRLDNPPPEESAVLLGALSALERGGLISTHQLRRVAAVVCGQ